MGKQRALQTQVKRTRKSTTEKVGGDIRECGTWVLRQTKSRQARVSEHITCKTPPTKDLSKKRKRQPPSVPSEVPSEESCIGENSIAVARMDDELADMGMWGYIRIASDSATK